MVGLETLFRRIKCGLRIRDTSSYFFLFVDNEGRNANSFKARVVVAPLVLAREMEARLSHQRVPARSRLYAVSRPGKSGALAYSLHSLPASLYKVSIRVLTPGAYHTQLGNIEGMRIMVPVGITRRPLELTL